MPLDPEKLKSELSEFFNKHRDTHSQFKRNKVKKVSLKKPPSGKYPGMPGNSHDRRIARRKLVRKQNERS